jgi:hypothetical protein
MAEEYRFQQKAPVIQEILNKVVDKSERHVGEFNANNITEEGWYDSIVLGRPEGSESDERYFLYHSPNGGQVCFSRRNSGKVYERLGVGHSWVNVSYNDYIMEHGTAMALNSYSVKDTQSASSIGQYGAYTAEGFYFDPNTNLIEYYAGDGGEVKHFHLSLPINDMKPDSIIKVRCIYRRGGSYNGVTTYKYDSDAYIYVSRSSEEGHDLSQLVSDFIKVKPLGGQHFPFTEGQQSWQDLAFLRDLFFANGTTYGQHLLKVNAEETGQYFLHIVGDFTTPQSWFAIDYVQVYTDAGDEIDDSNFTIETYSTAPASIDAELNKYYRIDEAVDILAVTLPAMTDLTTVRSVVIYLTTGSAPDVTISAADNKNVYYQDGFKIEAGSTYEINALFNGAAWIVAAKIIDTAPTT